MLVLSRKIGETIRIGTGVELVVLDVYRGRVKLGFAGPQDVAIRRGEHGPAGTNPDDPKRTNPLGACSRGEGASVAGHAPLRPYRIVSGV
jgi:carbon storage regulator